MTTPGENQDMALQSALHKLVSREDKPASASEIFQLLETFRDELASFLPADLLRAASVLHASSNEMHRALGKEIAELTSGFKAAIQLVQEETPTPPQPKSELSSKDQFKRLDSLIRSRSKDPSLVRQAVQLTLSLNINASEVEREQLQGFVAELFRKKIKTINLKPKFKIKEEYQAALFFGILELWELLPPEQQAQMSADFKKIKELTLEVEVHRLPRIFTEALENLYAVEAVNTPEGLFELTKIDSLKLTGQLGEISEDLGKLKHLRALHLESCGLTRLPESIGELENLDTLYLSKNRLTSLPKGFAKLKKLQTLDISKNPLVQFPMEITGCTNLGRLDMSKCRLQALPPEIVELKRLYQVSFSYNALTCLPDNFGGFDLLHTLNLEGNQLSTIPDAFTTMSGLRYLDLAKNKFVEIPRAICRLKDLAWLELDHNAIEEIPTEIEGMQSLRDLLLYENRIKTLPASFARLQKLQQLGLNGNSGFQFPDGLGEMNLHHLWLSNTGMTEIPASVFKLKKLGSLIVQSNQLTKIPKEIFKLMHLRDFDIQGNPLAAKPDPAFVAALEANRRLTIRY